jgi:C4-dicarboxylate transporter DctM subunit
VTLLFTLLLILLVALGTPLFVVLFFATLLFYARADIDLINIFVVMSDLLEKPYLLPIPLFTLAGFMLARSGAPGRVVRFAEAICGWIPGGLAVLCVATCAFLTTFTGASGVTIIALGGMLYPLLRERSYPEGFSRGLITSSGSLGLLFFPALPIFLYVTVYSLATDGMAPLSPMRVFLAGLFPGLLMMGLLMLYCSMVGIRLAIPRTPFDPREAWRAFRGGFWELTLPLWLTLALQSGSIGLTEIAPATLLYVGFVEIFVYRDIHPVRDLPRVVLEGMQLVGAITVILAVVLGYNNYLIDQQVPQAILGWIKQYISSPLLFLLGLNVFLLIVGCLMDIFSAMVAVLPLIIPLAMDFGVPPEHLAIVFLANLEIGYLTPPVGMNLFISSLHFRESLLRISRDVIPFIAILAAALMLITYVPSLSTWLPERIDGPTPTPVLKGASHPGTEGEALMDLFGDDEGLEDLLREIEAEQEQASQSQHADPTDPDDPAAPTAPGDASDDLVPLDPGE